MNPYIIIGILVLWAASLFGAGYWQNQAGHTAERVAWQAKDNKELSDANAQILKLNNEARATEHTHAEQLANIATSYEQERQNEITAKDVLIAKLRAGSVQLHDPYASSVQASGCATSTIAAGAGRGDAQAGSELSEQLGEFLISEASRADKVVTQLQACQAVVQSDRSGQ